jgi:hypothetical protein
MSIHRTVTKKILENIVHETFIKLGPLSSSSLLDSLKFLGFYYATNAGISINIEDLKTPDTKKQIIDLANKEIAFVSKQWEKGFLSDAERFQTIIDSWHMATETLKNRIVEYYKNFDPANNLYIMAFSGARGNMAQVRQLVGMRGLMSDKDGNIIDLPIQANFREGLSSIDYIISSYGARKGIVDTALKTADSGYLTRRLIYVAQDLVIREIDCKTKQGLLLIVKKKSTIKNLIGRSLISARLKEYPYSILSENEEILTEKNLTLLKKEGEIMLNIRSSLTCDSNGSICQKCYGWDSAHQKLISLGEAVGIIAAQSIGEPGTQLTMRTFHTGGIFTGEMVKQVLSPFSGKLIIPSVLKTITYRTNHGIKVLKLQQEAILELINWKGEITEILLEIGSYLYLKKSSFISKGQLIAQSSNQQSFIPGSRKLKPIYTSLSGEVKFEKLCVCLHGTSKIRFTKTEGVLWIASGSIFSFPEEIDFSILNNLKKDKAIGNLKIISPKKGIFLIEKTSLSIQDKDEKLTINFLEFTKNCSNYIIQFFPILKNYQYIDEQTILGYLYIFPIDEGEIYSLRKKNNKIINTIELLIASEKDIWKLNSDHISYKKTKKFIKTGNLLNPSTSLSRSGFLLKQEGFKFIFQHAIPMFMSSGTILKYRNGDFVLKNKLFATLLNYSQQTEDIVQGLPKIEELVEARKPKNKCYLASRPGIILKSNHFLTENDEENFEQIFDCDGILKCTLSRKYNKKKIEEKKKKKQVYYIAQSSFVKDNLILYENKLYKVSIIPTLFKPSLIEKNKYSFKQEITSALLLDDYLSLSEDSITAINNLLIPGKKNFSYWNRKRTTELILYQKQSNKNIKWKTIKKNITTDCYIYYNEKNDYIVETNESGFLFLEYVNPIIEYTLPLSSKFLFSPGSFVDIGEPITEGKIDTHDLLDILFTYHSILDGSLEGIKKSLHKFQLLLVNSIQSIYQSQDVDIASKHIEIIIRQMTAKVVIKDGGDTPFLPGEIINLSLITEVFSALKKSKKNKIVPYKTPKYKPKLYSATNCSLSKDGFLSAAGFQETRRILTKSAMEGSSDWLRGLKESIIVGRLIPAGSSFLTYKNYLDTVYLFKE